MGIPITIPGLSEFIKEIPNGNTLLIEGSMEPIKTIFVYSLLTQAEKSGIDVHYISSRAKEEVIEQMQSFNGKVNFPIIEERSSRHWKDHLKRDSVLVIDSFSYLILDDSLRDVRNILEDLDSFCKQKNAIVILVVEEGMLDEQINITTKHLADGIIRFMSKDTSKGVARFIRIPKWMNIKSFDDNIFYNFDGKKILVDLRARVT